MFYKAALIVSAIVLFQDVSAQRSITLQAPDGKPVSDAYVTITPLDRADKKKKVNELTGPDGQVSFSLPGTVQVEVQHASYMPVTDTLTADSKTYTLTALNIQLDQMVVTAQYSPDQIKNSLYQVQVINRDKIDRRVAVNVSELLSQELNVRIKQDNVLGSGLSLMGLGGEQVKYLLDGVPLLGRMNGDIDLSQINLNDVERIEVIEGPVSVLYGTNALGGVINIITRTDQKDKVQANVGTYYESVGVYNVDAGVGFSKKGHYLGLNGGRYFFDGYGLNDSLRDQEWNPKTQYFGALKYGYRFRRIRFLLNSNYLNEKISNRGNARSPLYITAFDDRYLTTRWNNSLTISGDIFKNHYFNIIGAYSYFKREKHTYRKDLVTLEEVMTDSTQQDTTQVHGGLLRGFISRKADKGMFNYQLGYDINLEQGSGERIEDKNQFIGDYAVFASVKIKPVSMLVIQPALRWAYNSSFKAPFTPSLNIKLSPLERLTFRLSYARGFRAPSVKELYFDFFDVNHNIYGNKALKAEFSNNIMFSMTYAASKDKHVVNVSPLVYFNDVHNDIELVRDYSNADSQSTALPFTYANYARNRIFGANLRIKYNWNEAFAVNVSGGVTGNNFTFDTNVSSSGYNFSPEASAEVSYLVPKAEVNVSVFYKYNGANVSPYLAANGAVGKQRIEDYHLLDITLTRRFWKDRITIGAGVKNLANVKTVATSGGDGAIHSSGADYVLMAWGRSYFATLKFNISK